jgi:DNA mismatch repair protein MutL
LPIQILPARLANQIAAGEVVERPASVVKELVENSLDAEANTIEIEIDKGGQKRILIRDNGKGIVKEELGLALSRHATSKIACLDDLEKIMSLGFRGEALASISSVSRLALTSKPATQPQAWQAESEGRDMQVQLHPAAHPDGSSVEVLDLFFNTPARRKFLRSEKTEFNHIDEVIRRIALSRFDVSFSVKHNGKLLRKYPAAKENSAHIKRIAAICGKDFAEQAIEISSSYQQIKLHGWLLDPSAPLQACDIQYFYVNGRMMRDKLINHGIRQAFEGLIDPALSPAYVLYLQIEPQQVDVNVHPAKHEVRFHQARLVHDFIYRAISDVLSRRAELSATDSTLVAEELPDISPRHDYISSLQVQSQAKQVSVGEGRNTYLAQSYHHGQSVNAQAAEHYQQLMSPALQSQPQYGLQASYMLLDDGHLLIKISTKFYVLTMAKLQAEYLFSSFNAQVPVAQPLLMPVSIEADAQMLSQAAKLKALLSANSIEIDWTVGRILLRKVPAGYRNMPWSLILPELLNGDNEQNEELSKHLFACLGRHTPVSGVEQVHKLWLWLSNHYGQQLEAVLVRWAKLIPLQKWLAQND